jgi:thiosulfate dehydrogenase [quinone] large subunit
MAPTTQAPPRTAPRTNGATPIVASNPATSRHVPHDSARDGESPFVRYLWAVTRIFMGWVFLWPFMDKMFGLGHETASADAVIHGGNPTLGFLSGSVGPFSGIYHSIAGAGVVNVLFMAGLLGIGVALLLGIAMKPACIAGATMVMLMWSAVLPPDNDLFLDNHVIYALLLIGLASVGAGKTLGLGQRWARTGIVQRHHWLT